MGASATPDTIPEAPLGPGADLPPSRPSLRVRVRVAGAQLWSTAWSPGPRRASTLTALQYGSAQALRLGSNLALAYLLFPEAFGLMAMVQVFMAALIMFSDLGLGPSIIQNKRGDDPAFYNTAWTLQIIRGFILWGLAAAVAWPAATFFDMPELIILLPLVGVGAAISGFDSTAFWSARRHLRLGRIVLVELGTQVVGIATTVGLAILFFMFTAYFVTAAILGLAIFAPGLQSLTDPAKLAGVVCLAIGGVVAPLARAIATHLVIDPSIRNRPRWEPTAFNEIFHFGKWIFVSTGLTFFAARMDVLLVGKLTSDAVLGVYNIGQSMALMLPSAITALGGAVVFPLFSRVVRERPQDLPGQVTRVRRILLVPATAGLAALILLGGWIVWILYDVRYHDAGWILQILAAGAPAMLVSTTYGNVLLALGKSREIVLILIPQILFLVTGSLVGYHAAPLLWAPGAAPEWAPIAGLVTGFAVTEWLNYPVVYWRARRYGVANFALDAKIFAITACAALLAYLLP